MKPQAGKVLRTGPALAAVAAAIVVMVFGPLAAQTPAAAQEDPVLGTGEVQVSLSWTGISDLDLHVIEPGGEELYYSNDQTSSGGFLDHDDIPGCSSAGGSWVENVFWEEGTAPVGTYETFVRSFNGCEAGSQSFILEVRINGELVARDTGSLTHGSDSNSVLFEVVAAGGGVELDDIGGGEDLDTDPEDVTGGGESQTLVDEEGNVIDPDDESTAGDEDGEDLAEEGEESAGEDNSADGDEGGVEPAVVIGAAVIAAVVGAAIYVIVNAAGGAAAASTGSAPQPDTHADSDSEADEERERTPTYLELTYPLGRSPRVFIEGWVYGARCIINGSTPDHRDVSDMVRWSGSGTFKPPVGRQSHPRFNTPGPNTIHLSINVDGVTEERTFAVNVVNTTEYARVSDLAKCPADAHGCPACPHPTVGPIKTGSPNVLIDGLPAARVGDTGIHAACCGPNTYTIAGGDPSVLIDGRPAAKKGTRTVHCGGNGEIITGSAGEAPIH